MMEQVPKVLICYRRADSTGAAGRLYDRLFSDFGRDSIFLDFEDLDSHFEKALAKVLDACEIVLVLIGHNWRGVKQGKHFAIDNEFDPFRLQIEGAIRANKKIIPIVLDGARMPAPSELPSTMRELSFRNAMDLSFGSDFQHHAERISRAIKNYGGVKDHITRHQRSEKPAPEPRNTPRPPVASESAGILLSYRRADSAAMAGRLHKALSDHFGSGAVYMDIDSIPFATDYRSHITSAMEGCRVVIALIGKHWTGKRFPIFQARIFDTDDPIRIEMQTALRMRIPVLPVLLDGVKIEELKLPQELRSLHTINAPPLDAGRDFSYHTERIIRAIEQILSR